VTVDERANVRRARRSKDVHVTENTGRLSARLDGSRRPPASLTAAGPRSPAYQRWGKIFRAFGTGSSWESKIVDFTLFGQRFQAIGAGPHHEFNDAVSIVVVCDEAPEHRGTSEGQGFRMKNLYLPVA